MQRDAGLEAGTFGRDHDMGGMNFTGRCWVPKNVGDVFRATPPLPAAVAVTSYVRQGLERAREPCPVSVGLPRKGVGSCWKCPVFSPGP